MEDLTEGEVYRLKYRDTEGASSDRHIIIKKLIMGDSSANSYIYAYCQLAMDFRQFRFDRIKALYSNGKIIDPYSLVEKYPNYENTNIDINDYANLAAQNEPEPEPPPPEKPKIDISKIDDIPTLQKMSRKFSIIFTILFILGLITISTVIFPILFFGGAACVLFTRHSIKKRIKELKAAEKP